MSDFQDYLYKKKIDSDAFKKAEPVQWQVWKEIFDQVHPDSFTAQKLYLINPLRRQYPFIGERDAITMKEKPKKPVMKPRAASTESTKEEDRKDQPVKAKPKMAVKPKVKIKPKILPQSGAKPEGEEAVSKEQKPKMTKPKIPMKPKIPLQRENEAEMKLKDTSKEGEKPKMAKPNIKPRPVIKKRPKTD
ncbi:hypothetical protein C900_04722 [Fulvivirga imtechensis AK7]|uniref:Uncharacterized protein n=1 Tax=Fulvivirga imtechensis AK7 TaxID=1237149 RepID=L8JLT3_9BACT|nr:hypothetical protein [Fulvivirga imtechensis]ELR69745.1 hypothetical protein C900_04722 [Fulvivirga imtechensis AK7]